MSAITTSVDADDEAACPHVRRVEREEEHEPQQHADGEATPQAPVVRDRDRQVEHDQEREQQPVAVAAGEALGVVLAIEVVTSALGRNFGHPSMLAPLRDDGGDGAHAISAPTG